MSVKKGTIALMGSGEMTSTMVEVHKELLSGIGDNPKAVFLDTPAGFQLNADLISERAVEYFRARVGRCMSVVSFKSKKTLTPAEAERILESILADEVSEDHVLYNAYCQALAAELLEEVREQL